MSNICLDYIDERIEEVTPPPHHLIFKISNQGMIGC